MRWILSFWLNVSTSLLLIISLKYLFSSPSTGTDGTKIDFFRFYLFIYLFVSFTLPSKIKLEFDVSFPSIFFSCVKNASLNISFLFFLAIYLFIRKIKIKLFNRNASRSIVQSRSWWVLCHSSSFPLLRPHGEALHARYWCSREAR
jgi:hypothetical protein